MLPGCSRKRPPVTRVKKALPGPLRATTQRLPVEETGRLQGEELHGAPEQRADKGCGRKQPWTCCSAAHRVPLRDKGYSGASLCPGGAVRVTVL